MFDPEAMRKIYLPLAGSISILCLILQSASVLAETSQLAAVSSQQVVTTETMSAASPTVPEAEVKVIEVPAPTSATSPLMVQTATETFPQAQAAQTATLEQNATQYENQVTSVSQLSDVQPTDWAFNALQSLIERYGVIAGSPDGTYQGKRPLTRYEFAAGLNAALERVNELIATGLANQISREDLLTLQRLKEEFAPELASLRGRVDNLETRTAEIEAQKFSTTTKLTGQVLAAVNAGSFSGRRIIDPTGAEIANRNPNPTTLYRVTLDLDTSFTGTDQLRIQVDSTSDQGKDNVGGYLEPNLGSVLDFSVKPPLNTPIVDRLYYKFTPFKDLTVSLGPVILATDYVDKNSYANLSFQDFSTLALVNNYIAFPIYGIGSGGVMEWKVGKGPFTVRAVYVAADAANPAANKSVVGAVTPFMRLLYPNSGGSRGLFGSPDQGTVEMEYSPSKTFALRLLYSGGNIFNGRFDVFGANLELALSPHLGIFGRYGYGSYSDTIFGDIHPNYWMAGVAFRDMFKPGALAGIAVGQPFIESAVGNATQTNIEAFYNFPLSDNIRITPLVQVIAHPANQDANGTIVTGTLRTTLSF